MGLSYDLTNVPNAFDSKGNITEFADQLIWLTMFVNLQEINKNNIDEWYHRLQFYALIDGFRALENITKEDLQDHIGLSTNAPYKTWNQFVAKMTKKWCQKKNFKPCNKRNPLKLKDIILSIHPTK